MPVTHVPQPFLSSLLSFDIYHLVGHSDPDGDCLGSQKALGSFLQRRGKKVHMVSPGPFRRREINHLKDDFLDHIPSPRTGSGDEEQKRGREAVVVLDCASADRIGHLRDEIADRFTLVIDHHASGAPFGDESLVDPTAPSVTYLVQLIIEELGERPTAEEAELLLLGLVTDTGFFRHISRGGEEIFAAVSRLAAYGATPNRAYRTMFGNRSLPSRRLAGRVMDRARLEGAGKIVFTFLNREDEAELGEGERDSDTIYGQLQNIEGVEGVVFLREEAEGDISAGLRSNSYLDMGSIAARFGGGGHPRAASFRWSGSSKALESKLMEVISPLLH